MKKNRVRRSSRSSSSSTSHDGSWKICHWFFCQISFDCLFWKSFIAVQRGNFIEAIFHCEISYFFASQFSPFSTRSIKRVVLLDKRKREKKWLETTNRFPRLCLYFCLCPINFLTFQKPFDLYTIRFIYCILHDISCNCSINNNNSQLLTIAFDNIVFVIWFSSCRS